MLPKNGIMMNMKAISCNNYEQSQNYMYEYDLIFVKE